MNGPINYNELCLSFLFALGLIVFAVLLTVSVVRAQQGLPHSVNNIEVDAEEDDEEELEP